MNRLLLFLLLMATLVSQGNAALLNLSWMNPYPTGADVYGLAVNAPMNPSRYLMVGAGGLLATNTDGATWQFLNSDTKNNLRSVTFGPARAVVVGDRGTLLTSLDGVNWSPVSGLTGDLRGVTYGGGYYVAVGNDNGSSYLITSTDGLNWTKQNIAIASPLNAVAYYGSFFVVVGDKGAIAWSQNANTWNVLTPITSANLVAVAPGSGVFVAVSDALTGARVFVSQTGNSWVSRTLASTLDNIRLYGVGYYNLNYAIAASGGQLVVSTDTVTWTSRVIQKDVDGEMLAVLGSARGWNAVGRGGKIYNSLSLYAEWSRFSTGPQFDSNDLAENGGYWVSVGNGGQVGGSGNGTVWVNRTSNTKQDLNAVAAGDIWWVAAGKGGTVMVSQLNGDNWMKRSLPVGGDFYAATYGAGRFLVGGNGGAMAISSDSRGTSWTTVSPGTFERIAILRYLNNRYFGGTDKGSVTSSNNGTSWVATSTGVGGEVRGLAWFQNLYWALVTNDQGRSELLSSPSGSVWTSVWGGDSARLRTLAANSEWLVALGEDGAVLSSSDGKNWDYQPNILGPGWEVLRVVNGEFVAAGKWGKIAQLALGVDPESYFGPLVPTSQGWYQSAWLGWINLNYYPVIYQESQGWWACSGPGLSGGQDSFWFYDFTLGWLWTSTSVYPWFYVSERNTWSLYDSSVGGIRWFYFSDTGRWQAVPMSGQ